MLKKFFWLLLLIPIFFSAQISKPLKFKVDVKPIGESLYEVDVNVKLDNKWHINSIKVKSQDIIPTDLKVSSKNSKIDIVGAVEERGNKIEEYSDVFKANMVYFKNEVDFVQKIRYKGDDKKIDLSVQIDYQTCDDKTCLAPDQDIFDITYDLVDNKVLEASNNEVSSNDEKSGNSIIISTLDVNNPINKECGDKIIKDDSNIWIFIFGFLGGLIALLTPCVYPMIPLTISYFTKNSKEKKQGRKEAMIYAFFIFLIFVLFTLPFHLISGINPDIFNQISTNVWINIGFFIIFLVFAISFFGYFDITIPSWLINKSDKASESGGYIGLFFMALTLVIVSFSCTGPVLGSILANAIQNPIQLTMAFGGCGLSWALVFGLFALFPQFLGNIPKSGGWMNSVKVVLGFMELALSLKFLSKADLVSKTFFLKREIFILIWVIISILIVIYLLGLIRFPHDSKGKIKFGKIRYFFIAVFSLSAIYLASLFFIKKPQYNILSGITPPLNVSFFDKEEGVLGLEINHDYFKALELAKEKNKPILIDFTGYGCENCRKMEEYVWSEPDIWKLLNSEVIIASLYVDDPETLPEDKQETVLLKDGRKRKLKTIGNKWSTFERENFNSNSQPFYVLVTPDGRVLNQPVAGYMSKNDFKSFLKCGIDTFKSIK